jgi:hypothetical protein
MEALNSFVSHILGFEEPQEDPIPAVPLPSQVPKDGQPEISSSGVWHWLFVKKG